MAALSSAQCSRGTGSTARGWSCTGGYSLHPGGLHTAPSPQCSLTAPSGAKWATQDRQQWYLGLNFALFHGLDKDKIGRWNMEPLQLPDCRSLRWRNKKDIYCVWGFFYFYPKTFGLRNPTLVIDNNNLEKWVFFMPVKCLVPVSGIL